MATRDIDAELQVFAPLRLKLLVTPREKKCLFGGVIRRVEVNRRGLSLAMANEAIVFWSYAHADDASDRGRIRLLAEHLRQEYALITGEALQLFLDRDSIEWGEQWRVRITEALSSSTFLIPVLTNRYFKSSECRKEILDFYGQAESRGLLKLMLPLLYISIPNFLPENPNELVALAARSQYVDWSALRLTDPDSPGYRNAVNGLAVRLAELGDEARRIELSTEEEDAQDLASPKTGLVDNLNRISVMLPIWLNAVEDDVLTHAQYDATNEVYLDRLKRIPNKDGMSGQRLGILHRHAKDELPIAIKTLALSHLYSSQTIELHPCVTGALRAIEESPEHLSTLVELRNAVRQAIDILNENIVQPGKRTALEFWQDNSHLGQLFRDLAEMYAESWRIRDETNSVVRGWHRDLEILFEGSGL